MGYDIIYRRYKEEGNKKYRYQKQEKQQSPVDCISVVHQ